MTALFHLVFVFGFSTAMAAFATSVVGLLDQESRGIATTWSRWLMVVSIVSLILSLYLKTLIA